MVPAERSKNNEGPKWIKHLWDVELNVLLSCWDLVHLTEQWSLNDVDVIYCICLVLVWWMPQVDCGEWGSGWIGWLKSNVRQLVQGFDSWSEDIMVKIWNYCLLKRVIIQCNGGSVSRSTGCLKLSSVLSGTSRKGWKKWLVIFMVEVCRACDFTIFI